MSREKSYDDEVHAHLSDKNARFWGGQFDRKKTGSHTVRVSGRRINEAFDRCLEQTMDAIMERSKGAYNHVPMNTDLLLGLVQ